MKLKRFLLLLLLVTALIPSISVADTKFIYQSEGKSYPYQVSQAGDSYHFEFDDEPESMVEQHKALGHVLQSLYNDPSIDFNNRRDYIRERAKCSFFASNFYDYTLCILPNEFSPNKTKKFNGFVTQLPNSMWLLTRFVLPVAMVGWLFFLLMKIRSNKKQG